MSASPSTTPLPLTGDNLIDASTNGFRWNLDASRTINWSIANGFYGEYWRNPPFVAQEVNQALVIYSGYINVKFNYLGYFSTPLAAAVADSQITFSLDASNLIFNSSAYWAYGYFPTSLSDWLYPGQSGDIYLNVRSAANFLTSYAPGSAGFALILHELGHTLGLKHPHDDGGTGHPTLANLGAKAFDQDWFSVMSYNDAYSWNQLGWNPATPLALDVLGLMALYGPNPTTNAGNDVHVLTRTNQYSTLWDAGGTDSLFFARNSEGWFIDLQTGKDATLDIKLGMAAPRADLLLSAPKTLTWLLGDYENLTATNFDDVIHGSENDNVIYGILGNDTIDGGAGHDTAAYLGRRSNFTITKAGATVTVKDRTPAEGIDTLTNIETLRFSDAQVELDVSGPAGQSYRLYQAAFNRTPDQAGLTFWFKNMMAGVGLHAVSVEFVNSPEFKATYGVNPTPEQIVTRFYQNVLGRQGEPGGFNYWVGSIKAGTSISDVLTGFSESPENTARVAGVISNGVTLDLF